MTLCFLWPVPSPVLLQLEPAVVGWGRQFQMKDSSHLPSSPSDPSPHTPWAEGQRGGLSPLGPAAMPYSPASSGGASSKAQEPSDPSGSLPSLQERWSGFGTGQGGGGWGWGTGSRKAVGHETELRVNSALPPRATLTEGWKQWRWQPVGTRAGQRVPSPSWAVRGIQPLQQ